MKPNWIWCLPLIATMGLSACDTTSSAGGNKTGTQAASTGIAGDAQSLAAYHWQLRQAFTPQGNEDQSWFLSPSRQPIQLDFAEQRLVVKNLCNVVTAGYSINGQRIAVQRAASTLMACPDSELMALEQRVARILPQAKQWSVLLGQEQGEKPATLSLQFIDGTRWQLQGEPTAQTKYGNAGERIFLEVAPQLEACSHPLMPNFKCMRVREIRYADNGVKNYTGEWENFYQQIQGYEHQAGTGKVLRIMRYKVKNPPADASSLAYVLDMVVESYQEKR
ncbi:META and DUF4377 domain-containing protein [Comamonas composti]|uniref:META and DUF4377 domain-containing protein n=1 Tax=Comamonas composti TaxID=408558 RepID=UPI00040C3DB2|nr:META and DUF4377 domain-containing protein [Comamonas composti]